MGDWRFWGSGIWWLCPAENAMTDFARLPTGRVSRRSFLLASAGLAVPAIVRADPVDPITPVGPDLPIPDTAAGRQLAWVLEQVNRSARRSDPARDPGARRSGVPGRAAGGPDSGGAEDVRRAEWSAGSGPVRGRRQRDAGLRDRAQPGPADVEGPAERLRNRAVSDQPALLRAGQRTDRPGRSAPELE